MNKIETLIKELCPNGVEWNSINNYTRSITSPKKLQKNQYEMSGQIPIIDQGATFIAGFSNINEYLPHGEYVIFGDHSEHIKFVNFPFVQGADGLKILVCNKNIKPKYLYYCFSNFYKKEKNYKRHWSKAKETLIPVPPLEIQEEIVKILDKFTDYVTELTTELTLRQKQYHYYRDMLLSLENEEFESKKLGEVCNFIRGNGLQKKDFVEEGFPVIHYGQIYTKYGFSTRDTISFANGEIYNKLRKAKRGDIIMATTSENTEDLGKSVVWEGEQEVGISGDSYIIQTSQNPRFINYYLQSIHFQLQKENKVTGTKVIRINSKDMVNFDIKVPSLLRQKQIVSILDNFDVLTSNLVFGLPKEIELRQKQYEYYRDKLLSFD